MMSNANTIKFLYSLRCWTLDFCTATGQNFMNNFHSFWQHYFKRYHLNKILFCHLVNWTCWKYACVHRVQLRNWFSGLEEAVCSECVSALLLFCLQQGAHHHCNMSESTQYQNDTVMRRFYSTVLQTFNERMSWLLTNRKKKSKLLQRFLLWWVMSTFESLHQKSSLSLFSRMLGECWCSQVIQSCWIVFKSNWRMQQKWGWFWPSCL